MRIGLLGICHAIVKVTLSSEAGFGRWSPVARVKEKLGKSGRGFPGAELAFRILVQDDQVGRWSPKNKFIWR